mgnify:CR=1 FL=1
MKNYIYIILVILLCACNGENVPDCFQNSGDIVVKEFPVSEFTKITVFEHVEMILKEAANNLYKMMRKIKLHLKLKL